MHMVLRCTGGFTGPAGAQTRSVDLAQLPPAQASELEKLVQACDFFALPDKLLKPAPQSWTSGTTWTWTRAGSATTSSITWTPSRRR